VRRLSRLSAAFTLVSDASLAVLGGAIKRREAISGRLADALGWLYLGSAAVKRFWDDGQPEEDVPFLRWSCERALRQVQEALVGVLDNFPSRTVAWTLRTLAFPLGARYRPPGDAVVAEVARALSEDGEARRRLTADIHVPAPTDPGLGALEEAFRRVALARPLRTRIREAARQGSLAPDPADSLVERAVGAAVIDPEEARTIREADAARAEAIAVDAFAPEEYASHRRAPAA